MQTEDRKQAASVVDLLLRPELESVQKRLPTKRFRLERLSAQAGGEVAFTLRALTHQQAQDLKEDPDLGVQTVLAGVVDPDLKDPRLREKFGGTTPADLVRRLLLPGEVDALARAVEMLTGYRTEVLREIEKN